MEKQSDLIRRQGQIRELTSKIAKEHIAPNAAECDRRGSFPLEAIRRLGEAELPGLIISEADGGAGEGRICFASKAIEVGGSDFLKKKWLPKILRCQSLGAFAVHEPDSGSNAGAITTRAIRGGDFYVVNGSKFFITSGGEADVCLVLVPNGSGKMLPKRHWGYEVSLETQYIHQLERKRHLCGMKGGDPGCVSQE